MKNRKVWLSIMALSSMIAPMLAEAYTLTRQLEVGMTGPDVSAVQTFLAADPSLYPEGLVTGYFGLLTKAAVARFQTRNEIPPVGRIGPMTLPVLNAQMNGGTSVGTGLDRSAPTIFSVSVSTTTAKGATINWSTNENASASIYYSTSPIMTLEAVAFGQPISIGGNTLSVHTDFRTSHSATLTDLDSNTQYYYVIYVKDAAGNDSLTWPTSFRTK